MGEFQYFLLKTLKKEFSSTLKESQGNAHSSSPRKKHKLLGETIMLGINANDGISLLQVADAERITEDVSP